MYERSSLGNLSNKKCNHKCLFHLLTKFVTFSLIGKPGYNGALMSCMHFVVLSAEERALGFGWTMSIGRNGNVALHKI